MVWARKFLGSGFLTQIATKFLVIFPQLPDQDEWNVRDFEKYRALSRSQKSSNLEPLERGTWGEQIMTNIKLDKTSIIFKSRGCNRYKQNVYSTRPRLHFCFAPVIVSPFDCHLYTYMRAKGDFGRNSREDHWWPSLLTTKFFYWHPGILVTCAISFARSSGMEIGPFKCWITIASRRSISSSDLSPLPLYRSRAPSNLIA